MSTALRICIADDEADMRDYFARILPSLGHEVVAAAENGRQLIADCTRCSPDLVITDFLMPELDGLSAVETIRRDRPVPVIVVSAHDDAVLTRQCGSGPIFYLTKPINRQGLRQAITELMAENNTV